MKMIDLSDGDLILILGLVRKETQSFPVVDHRKDDRIPQHVVDYYDHLLEIESKVMTELARRRPGSFPTSPEARKE